MSTLNWIRISNQQTVPQHDDICNFCGFANGIGGICHHPHQHPGAPILKLARLMGQSFGKPYFVSTQFVYLACCIA